MNTTVEPSARTQSKERLYSLLRHDSKVYAIIRRVSASGMTRWIDFYTIVGDDRGGELYYLTGHIANATGYKRTKEGLKVEGTGMDMVFAVLHELGLVLHTDDTGEPYALKHEVL